jgi:hypothetical protein
VQADGRGVFRDAAGFHAAGCNRCAAPLAAHRLLAANLQAAGKRSLNEECRMMNEESGRISTLASFFILH